MKRRMRMICEVSKAVRRMRTQDRITRVAMGKTSSCHLLVRTATATGQDSPACDVGTEVEVVAADKER